jgi:hypothetical protein
VILSEHDENESNIDRDCHSHNISVSLNTDDGISKAYIKSPRAREEKGMLLLLQLW